ncbi:MAG: hypothetical protein JW991_05150 [Candidatus Pacebacteria bacterium]|nr:hypothetical protein [Candidatus Paceibacterota bacterium]
MSVLGLDVIKKRIKKEKLVENLGQRELKNPEGVGLDLRLGEVHKIIKGGAFIEADQKKSLGLRQGVETKLVARYQKEQNPQAEITLGPGDYYLVLTLESLNTPPDLMPVIYPRSSLFRAGLLLLNTKIDPGYQGPLTFGLANLSSFEVKLQLGARICNLVFFKIEGKTINYRGQHQGGRVSFTKKERQV